MRIGTKSVLFGAHQFMIHPWFVAAAWWKLYGFPFDPRLWVAFFVHDVGYIGKPNMDGEEGESHPFTGASIMGTLFDARDRWGHDTPLARWYTRIIGRACDRIWGLCPQQGFTWYCFSFYHSRFLAKRYGAPFSKLCVADKLSICLTPAWLYLPMVRATGEIHEYMRMAEVNNAGQAGKYASMQMELSSQVAWYLSVQAYLRRWVAEHKDGRPDTWTPNVGGAA